jgi:hypothetical protein
MIALTLLGPYGFGYSTTFFDLLMFALGSFVLISILILYYDKIPKSNNSKSEFDNPIYQSKDFLVKSINHNDGLLFNPKSLTISSKIIISVLIVVFVTAPFGDFIGFIN